MYRQILIPTDGSELSNAAVEQALAFARSLGAAVTVFTAYPPARVLALSAEQLAGSYADYARVAREESARRLADVEVRAKAAGVPCQTLMAESDQPHAAIIRAAEDIGADLIAMASHGRRGISGLVLGSETLKVLTHSTIPVLVFRKSATG